ncbi:hypothetical protein FZC33_03250 [Labrys sp. KNU-23]|uniref:hypothetical protein n=1 Tax=Labrys sp. KNU-23 TaxID=2789216 RepID=UPI0011EC24C8|nr:hypothetical protein [Labrys sp. KNU-23]QEN85277.1 hypothetical protein FZC33_03250 [Labrys sp. KNU-23]
MTRKPKRTERERDQPYATEREEYRFDKVKPPTDPEERRAHGKPAGGGKRTPDKGPSPHRSPGPHR